MDPWILPSSIDGMLIEFDLSSSYPNSVNGPAFSGESVSSNYMELEEANNSPPPPNPNPYYNIPDFVAANIDYLHFYQMQMYYLFHFHYLSGLPLLPIPSVPMYVNFLISFYVTFGYFPFPFYF